MLDEDQELAFRLSNCHNLIISGQAGTGKTYLVKRTVRHWTNEKKIAIVCSTGIAPVNQMRKFTDCNKDLLPQGQKDAPVVVLITLRLLGIKDFDESQ